MIYKHAKHTRDFFLGLFTGLPYGNPSRKIGRFLRFIIFRVGKSLACHSPGKWCLALCKEPSARIFFGSRG